MTLDEIRLQQLLSPFNNQNTGVMNTNNALPFINTGQVYQNLQNTDLVNQLIQKNQMKANMFSRPNMMNVAGDIVPSGITTVAPLQNLGIDTSYGVANTPNVIGQQSGVDVYEADDGTPYYIDPDTGQEILAPDTVEAYKRQSGYYGKEPSGIAKLFEFLGNIPTPMNILRGGLESLQGFNQRLRNTEFARSKTLAEYFDRRSRAKNAARMAERAADFSERTSGAGATGGGRDFSTPAGKSTSYEEASRAFGTGR